MKYTIYKPLPALLPYLWAIIALLPLSTFGQESKADTFFGVWELVGLENSNTQGNTVKIPPGNFKIFGADNSYHFMVVTKAGACYSQTGSFKVLSDSTYVEQIGQALNQSLEGNAYEIQYHFMEDGHLVIAGKVNQVSYKETWRRVSACVNTQ
ncbi:DUF4488 domain-containing protein [Parapedobacter sp. DT-150]|uniref:DUF4488 domain-containing protein n=1 Tax=Parapedobacter sp. DT-150 TaxID=3396162 RepID=UPI003F1C74B4